MTFHEQVQHLCYTVKSHFRGTTTERVFQRPVAPHNGDDDNQPGDTPNHISTQQQQQPGQADRPDQAGEATGGNTGQ